MQQGEVRDLLRKRDGGKIDSYMPRTVKKKDKEQDLMNLLQTWTHCLLACKCIYPSAAFAQRDILGIAVPVASSRPLKEYLDGFFGKLRPHLHHLNHLQVVILASDGRPIETNTLHIDTHEQEKPVDDQADPTARAPNRLQKDIQIKSFLSELKEKLKQGFIRRRRQQVVSFRFRVGYRMQEFKQKTSSTLLDDWVKKEPMQCQGNILSSLKTNSLNLIYEVQH